MKSKNIIFFILISGISLQASEFQVFFENLMHDPLCLLENQRFVGGSVLLISLLTSLGFYSLARDHKKYLENKMQSNENNNKNKITELEKQIKNQGDKIKKLENQIKSQNNSRNQVFTFSDQNKEEEEEEKINLQKKCTNCSFINCNGTSCTPVNKTTTSNYNATAQPRKLTFDANCTKCKCSIDYCTCDF